MRRTQIYLDDDADDALAAEASRRGISKSELIRRITEAAVPVPKSGGSDPWQAMTGWFSDGGVESVDDVIYGPKR